MCVFTIYNKIRRSQRNNSISCILSSVDFSTYNMDRAVCISVETTTVYFRLQCSRSNNIYFSSNPSLKQHWCLVVIGVS